jgi:hypothetical protein
MNKGWGSNGFSQIFSGFNRDACAYAPAGRSCGRGVQLPRHLYLVQLWVLSSEREHVHVVFERMQHEPELHAVMQHIKRSMQLYDELRDAKSQRGMH